MKKKKTMKKQNNSESKTNFMNITTYIIKVINITKGKLNSKNFILDN